MLNSDIEKLRLKKARQIKECRELFGIRFSHLQRESGLSSEVLYRIEKGSGTWSIDSEIIYLTAINKLIDKKLTDNPTLKLPLRPDLLKQYQRHTA